MQSYFYRIHRLGNCGTRIIIDAGIGLVSGSLGHFDSVLWGLVDVWGEFFFSDEGRGFDGRVVCLPGLVWVDGAVLLWLEDRGWI
jgi:hypothetical protein